MGKKTQALKSGKQVELADWEDLEPEKHGKALLSQAWDPDASRTGLKFYKSTEEYMRNAWAEQNMHPTRAKLNDQDVLLYYNKATGSWHTAEALDIDHVVQWKDHFKALGVANMAEAQMAYNDVSNLRLLPSAVNRARDSADKVVETHGLDSQQWAKWCRQRFGFDPNENRPAFDPDKDAAVRRQSTLEAEWTAKHTRKDLGFDTRVENKWFEHELARSRVGEVTVQRPVPPGDAMRVSLFRCAATGQLCTRDAFDIDHQIAFETLLKELPKHTPDGKLYKADVLDAFNETSNLRLVSRAANASHEWELTARGEYRDADKEAPERPNEFRDFIVDKAMTLQEQRLLQAAIAEYAMRQHYKMEVWGKLKDQGVIDFRDPRGKVVQLNEQTHPDNPGFVRIRQRIDELDPKREVLPTDDLRDNLAAALTARMRAGQVSGPDAVEPGGPDKRQLFAVQSPGQANERHVSIGVTEGAFTPMAYSTAMSDKALLQQQQALLAQQASAAQAQQRNPGQGVGQPPSSGGIHYS